MLTSLHLLWRTKSSDQSYVSVVPYALSMTFFMRCVTTDCLKHDIQVAQQAAMQSALKANEKLKEKLELVGAQIARLMQDNERHIASITQLRKSTGVLSLS